MVFKLAQTSVHCAINMSMDGIRLSDGYQSNFWRFGGPMNKKMSLCRLYSDQAQAGQLQNHFYVFQKLTLQYPISVYL